MALKYFETTIRVPMPDGALAWGPISRKIEPAFEALAAALAKSGIEGIEISHREFRPTGKRPTPIVPPEQVVTAPPANLPQFDDR